MRSRILAAGAAFAAGLAVTPASAAPAPACQEVAFSPTFSRDRTMWCSTSVTDDGGYVFRSTDAGRSWSRGVQVAGGNGRHFTARVIVSPLYATDRRVLVWTATGMYESRDGGLTFSPEAVSTPVTPPTPYVETLGTGTPRAAFVHGVGGDFTYDTELGNRRLAGAPGYNVFRYLVPTSFGTEQREAVALAHPAATYYHDNQAMTPETTAAFICTLDFICREKGYDFGTVFTRSYGPLGRPDQHYVVAVEDIRHPDNTHTAGKALAWRTNDAGRSWTPWNSVAAILDRQPRGATWDATLTASPDRRTVFLSVATVVKTGPDPRYDHDDTYAMALWRSDDDGATWRRLSVPWTRPPGLGAVTVTAQVGNRLYATASRHGYLGLYCSLDNGRSWRAGICR